MSPSQRQEEQPSNLYGRFYDTVYSWRDYEDSCRALDTLFRNRSKPPRSLLDLACGTGSHSVLLAQRGYFVVGIDSSRDMIRQAQENAAREHVDAHFVVADLRCFRLQRTFEAAFGLFGAFSYLTTDKDVANALSSIHAHLVRGGLLVFDAWCSQSGETCLKQGYRVAQEGARHALVFSETETGPAARHIALRLNCLVLDNDRVVNQYCETHPLRVFAPDEVQGLLEKNGFHSLETRLRNRDRNMDVVAEAI